MICAATGSRLAAGHETGGTNDLRGQGNGESIAGLDAASPQLALRTRISASTTRTRTTRTQLLPEQNRAHNYQNKTEHTGSMPAPSRPRITKETITPSLPRANPRLPNFDQISTPKRPGESTPLPHSRLTEHPGMLICTPGSTPHPKVASNGRPLYRLVAVLAYQNHRPKNPESRISLGSCLHGQTWTALHSVAFSQSS